MINRYKSDGPAALDGIAASDVPSIFVHLEDALFPTATKSYGQIIDELGAYGYTWVSYMAQNPDSGTQQTIRMWLACTTGISLAQATICPTRAYNLWWTAPSFCTIPTVRRHLTR